MDPARRIIICRFHLICDHCSFQSFLSYSFVISLSFQPQVYPQATWCGFKRETMFLYPGIQWKQGTMSQKSLGTRLVSHKYYESKVKLNATARLWRLFFFNAGIIASGGTGSQPSHEDAKFSRCPDATRGGNIYHRGARSQWRRWRSRQRSGQSAHLLR